MRVEKLEEWSTALVIVDFDATEEFNSALARFILNMEGEYAQAFLKEKDTPQYWTRFSQFHHEQRLLERPESVVKTLRQMLLDGLSAYYSNTRGTTCPGVEFISAWANVNRTTDWHGPHSHFTRKGESVSGVYWVQYDSCEPDESHDGHLIYLDPRGFSNPDRYEKILQPLAGRMVLHPSWLGHVVSPMRSSTPRISVAFDCKFLEK